MVAAPDARLGERVAAVLRIGRSHPCRRSSTCGSTERAGVAANGPKELHARFPDGGTTPNREQGAEVRDLQGDREGRNHR